jgi:hypothetical protein
MRESPGVSDASGAAGGPGPGAGVVWRNMRLLRNMRNARKPPLAA